MVESSSSPIYEVILAGKEGVGKTSIFNRLYNGTFVEGSGASLGVEFFESTQDLPSNERVKFRLWDTGGQERYCAVTNNYYRRKHAVVLVFSVEQTMSPIQLKFYLQDAIEHAPKYALYVFVCNKIDLERDCATGILESSEIEDFLSQQRQELERNDRLPPLFFRTSAKTGVGINDALRESLVAIHERAAARRSGGANASPQAGQKRRTTGSSTGAGQTQAPSSQSPDSRSDEMENSVKLHEDMNKPPGQKWQCPSCSRK